MPAVLESGRSDATPLPRDFLQLLRGRFSVAFCRADVLLKRLRALPPSSRDLAAPVEEMPERLRALVLTASGVGLRWGEAIALQVTGRERSQSDRDRRPDSGGRCFWSDRTGLPVGPREGVSRRTDSAQLANRAEVRSNMRSKTWYDST